MSLVQASLLFLRVHIISFPATQVLVLVVGPLAEIFPLVYETFQYAKGLKTTKKETYGPVILLNLTSFTLGYVLAILIADFKDLYYVPFPFF